MLLDHIRETFYLHFQVSDPMLIAGTPADLFASRMLSHLCAPIFVFLAGLSACLYASPHNGSSAVAASFLWKRGVFLVVMEITVVNFAWTFALSPTTIYLQVIWAIGLSMLALSVLVRLPRSALIVLGVTLVAGHNLLDDLHFAVGHVLHVPWAVLHDRGWIALSETLRLRTSYPVLPWIGVIALGYAAGAWYLPAQSAERRQKQLLACGSALLAGFVVVRLLNGYGDKPWVVGDGAGTTLMSIVNVTKYPPSLLFLALTLGIGLLILLTFERREGACWLQWLAVFGAVPMFFYVLHLYVLKLLYWGAMAIWGTNHGNYFGVEAVWILWLCTPLMALALYPAVHAFANFKARRRDLAWLTYL